MTRPLRIKICGITNPDDARQAAELGADAVGLNFHPASPRCIDQSTARAIMAELPLLVEPVAVVTNSEQLQVLYDSNFKYFQWHGKVEDFPEFSPGARPMFRPIVAFRVKDRKTLGQAEAWLNGRKQIGQLPAAVLIDGYQKDQLGGTGQTVPWDTLADFHPPVPLILAGGLTPENVAEAVRTVRPWGVDVASGIESSPGKKDVDKMRRFIDNARSAI
jgi:phosphoribosylanthranilate isomerase